MKQIISKVNMSGGLYILNTWVPRSIVYFSIISLFEAYYQLGHSSLPVLKKLCPQFHNVVSLDCESCWFVKHHCNPSGTG